MPTPLRRMVAQLERDDDCYHWCVTAPNGHPMFWTKCYDSPSNARRGLTRILTAMRVEGVDIVMEGAR